MRKKKIKIKLTVEYDQGMSATEEEIVKALDHFAHMLKGTNCSLFNVNMKCIDFKFMKR